MPCGVAQERFRSRHPPASRRRVGVLYLVSPQSAPSHFPFMLTVVPAPRPLVAFETTFIAVGVGASIRVSRVPAAGPPQVCAISTSVGLLLVTVVLHDASLPASLTR